MADLDRQFKRDVGDPTRHTWEGTITGSETLSLSMPRNIKFLQVIQLASAAPGTDYFTYMPDASRAKEDTVTVYAWLNNAASVAAANVRVLVISD